MDISEGIVLVAGLISGCVLGLIYFGGLWWTVRQLPSSRHPGSLAIGSLVARLGILATGLFVVAQFGPAALLMSGLGLLLIRQFMIHHVQSETMRAS